MTRKYFNRKERLFAEETCATCGDKRRVWRKNLGRTRECRACAARRSNRTRFPNGPTPIVLVCIDCGQARTVNKISAKARTPIRCKSCAMKAAVTPEMRAARSERFSGAGSNFWQGGVTAESKRLRNEARYREWRRSVFKRDGYTCQDCGLIGGALHADHIKPFALYPELRFELSNGRTLCEPCHRKTDTYGPRTRARSAAKEPDG